MRTQFKAITHTRSRAATARIYIAGDYDQALEAVRFWCSERGDCWALERCDYVYTGGQEAGVKLTRIDYPRFPLLGDEELHAHAEEMAEHLLLSLHQASCTVVGPEVTTFLSRHPGD